MHSRKLDLEGEMSVRLLSEALTLSKSYLEAARWYASKLHAP